MSDNERTKLARKLQAFKVSPTGKVDTYRTPVNKIKTACTVDGTKRGASTTCTIQPVYIDNVLKGFVVCNGNLTPAQALIYFETLQ